MRGVLALMGRLQVRRTRLRSAFTLVELMIVLIIIGVLAGIVVASISSPAEQSREATLKDQLRIMRSQILLYKLHHNDTPPVAASLAQLLVERSDLQGNIVTADGPDVRGPYLSSFPPNPYNGRNDVMVLAPGATVQANDTTGWIYQVDGAGGFVFVANTSRSDRQGKPLSEY